MPNVSAELMAPVSRELAEIVAEAAALVGTVASDAPASEARPGLRSAGGGLGGCGGGGGGGNSGGGGGAPGSRGVCGGGVGGGLSQPGHTQLTSLTQGPVGSGLHMANIRPARRKQPSRGEWQQWLSQQVDHRSEQWRNGSGAFGRESGGGEGGLGCGWVRTSQSHDPSVGQTARQAA